MAESSNLSGLLSYPAVYRICIPGRLKPWWSDYLYGMTITTETTDQATVTVLTGELPDQAALMGVLSHLYNCNIPLIRVEFVNWHPLTGNHQERESPPKQPAGREK